MRVISITLLLLALAVGAAMLLWLKPRDAEWTTDSPAALAELQEGLAAEMKHYGDEALAHYQAALAADPDLVIAKLKLVGHTEELGKERVETLRRELATTPTEALNDRERLLLRIVQQHRGKEGMPVDELITSYLATHPDDPYVLSLRCNRLWRQQELSAAERCYQRLLATDPNWVEAQNRLGYIAMAQGRFAEAKERFKTYLYIAPDQANPHDSMGELLTIIGRYDEAEEQLRQSIAIRPSFCSSYRILAWALLLQDRYQQAREVLDEGRRVPACATGHDLAAATCSVETWAAAERGDWEEVVRVGEEVCSPDMGDALTARHHALLELGRDAEARALVAQFAEGLEARHDKNRAGQALVLHFQADQLMADGQPAAAVERLRQADELLEYWGNANFGIFKLYNQLRLALALRQAGEEQESEQVLARLAAVNPRFAADTLED